MKLQTRESVVAVEQWRRFQGYLAACPAVISDLVSVLAFRALPQKWWVSKM